MIKTLLLKLCWLFSIVPSGYAVHQEPDRAEEDTLLDEFRDSVYKAVGRFDNSQLALNDNFCFDAEMSSEDGRSGMEDPKAWEALEDHLDAARDLFEMVIRHLGEGGIGKEKEGKAILTLLSSQELYVVGDLLPSQQAARDYQRLSGKFDMFLHLLRIRCQLKNLGKGMKFIKSLDLWSASIGSAFEPALWTAFGEVLLRAQRFLFLKAFLSTLSKVAEDVMTGEEDGEERLNQQGKVRVLLAKEIVQLLDELESNADQLEGAIKGLLESLGDYPTTKVSFLALQKLIESTIWEMSDTLDVGAYVGAFWQIWEGQSEMAPTLTLLKLRVHIVGVQASLLQRLSGCRIAKLGPRGDLRVEDQESFGARPVDELAASMCRLIRAREVTMDQYNYCQFSEAIAAASQIERGQDFEDALGGLGLRIGAYSNEMERLNVAIEKILIRIKVMAGSCSLDQMPKLWNSGQLNRLLGLTSSAESHLLSMLSSLMAQDNEVSWTIINMLFRESTAAFLATCHELRLTLQYYNIDRSHCPCRPSLVE